MGTEIATEDERQKKGRRRKKQLYTCILQQMEFYFSDANLSKDRFLSSLTKDNPFVDISVFLKFNKILKLTNSVKDITKAVAKSDLLELSQDHTHVKRKLPVVAKTNVDECTLYVERLKSDATHDWLSTIFSEFGNVTYVSIPKYQHSGMIKGFAFVEFEQEENVQTALQYFEKIGCKIPSCMEPEKLCSIVTFSMEPNSEEKGAKKRLLISGNEEELYPKRTKFDEGKVQIEIAQETHQEEAVDDSGQEISAGDDKQKKKQKKPHKKKLNLKELGLQVLSKKEWKKMRNRYLDMQRKSMKELKMHLNRQRFAVAKYDAYKSQITNDNGSQASKEKIELVPEIEFVPKVIVKMALQEPCYTPKVLRRRIRTYSPDIKYVEIPFGSTDAYLRFRDSKSAEAFCSSDYKDQVYLLDAEEEKSYWNKIRESASVKKEKQIKAGKVRGRDKLLKKAEKYLVNHIRFNEEVVE